jgi:hypothetical protein
LVMTVGDHKFGDWIFWTMFKSFWATTKRFQFAWKFSQVDRKTFEC